MRYYLTIIILGLALWLPGHVQAAEPFTQQYNTLNAQVTSIDKTTHTLTLLNDRHETIILQVDPAKVTRFDEIKVGQNVVVREQRSVALALEKDIPGEKPKSVVTTTTEKAAPGQNPSISTERTENIKGEITAIDTTNSVVTVKGPKGNSVNILARDPKRLEGLKVGDKVWATVTQGFAISVEPATKQATNE